MKSTKIPHGRNTSKEKSTNNSKIKHSAESNPNFRNSFFRSLFQRKSKTRIYYNENSKNRSLLGEDETHKISSYRYNSSTKRVDTGKNNNKFNIDEKNNTQTSKSKSRVKIRNSSNRQLNNNTKKFKKYVHVNKSFLDSLFNVKPKINTHRNKNNNRTNTNRTNIINNIPKIQKKKKSTSPDKIKNSNVTTTKSKNLVQLKYKEYPNYSMNIFSVLKQVNDFNNKIYGNSLEQESNITTSRFMNNNDNSSIIDEIKNIPEPKLNFDKFNNNRCWNMNTSSERNGKEIKATRVKLNLKKKNYNYDYRNDKDFLYKNCNTAPEETSININDYFVDKNKRLMSPIFSLQNSKQNTENYLKNVLTQNSFSIQYYPSQKINYTLTPTLTENFIIKNKILVKNNKNEKQKIESFSIYPKRNWRMLKNIGKYQKIEDFKILGRKSGDLAKNNNENNNIANLNFKDDDEIISYIKDKIQKIKDSEYNNGKIKYNYFTLSRKFRGRNLYEIGLENNIEEINKIIQKENIEIEHEPVLFITQKEYNNLKNKDEEKNKDEIEKYKKLVSDLKSLNSREEQKYKSLENDYNKLLNQKNYTNNESDQYINKLTEENLNLKKEKDKLMKYIYELQEYNKKLTEQYENKITNILTNNIKSNFCFKKRENNSSFDVNNSSIENNSAKKTSLRDEKSDFQEQLSSKEKSNYNNPDSKNENYNKTMTRIKNTLQSKLDDSNKKNNGNKKPNKISDIAKMLEMKLKAGLNNTDNKDNNKNDKIITNNEDIENLIETKPFITHKNKKKKITFDEDE